METQSTTLKNTGSHHAAIDTTRTKPLRILQVVANPTTSTTTGWPVGFWAAELSHPYYEFTEAGYDVTITSPNGGKVEVDALSDPRDPSKWSADDLISMGFLNTPELTALAKPPHARSFPASFPRMWCSTSESPQGWRSSARRSRVGGRLSIPNFSGSPTALVLILAKRQYSACEERTSVVK